RVSGGISEFSDAKSVGASLIPCVKKVAKHVKDDQKASTPIYLAATAGMRLLNMTNHIKSELILLSIKNALQTEFGLSATKRVEIITGQDEGLFSWISTNYLSESLKVDTCTHE